MPARPSTDTNIVTAPRFWDWQRQNRTFEHVALFDSAGKGYNLGASDARHEAEQVSGVRVTADFFSVLGVRPFLGREFRREEETAGNDRVVVLGYGLWSRRYGSDRGVVGQPIRIDGESYTVVGVMPREFRFQFWSDERELWVPAGWNDGDRSRNSHSVVAIGRLKPGVAVTQATADIAGIQGQVAKQAALAGLALVLAAIGIGGVVSYSVAQAKHEIGIRAALGAQRRSLLWLMITRSMTWVVLGVAAGGAMSIVVTRLLKSMLYDVTPADPVVLTVVVGILLAVALAASYLPARRAARVDLLTALRSE